MFKPRRMTRTLIIGAKHDIETTINLLHSLEIAHIVDYKPAVPDNAKHSIVPIPHGCASHRIGVQD